MKILLVSPYHGGSHQAWAEGYAQHSQHTVHLLTLPDRFWKWRMHGGAVTLARRFNESPWIPDLILATDMLDLSTFLALTRNTLKQTPAVLYMHENQLTYPLPANGDIGPMRRQLGERDRHYAFINYTSMLAADGVFFNSRFHLDSFFEALPNFLKHFPEYNELNSVQKLKGKSQVLHVGIDLARLQNQKMANKDKSQRSDRSLADNQPQPAPPLILWNQRWEYDKNPEDFFASLYQLVDAGIEFRLALCGQQYGQRPPAFEKAIATLSERIVHTGYADENTYRRLLWAADVTFSTAHHEFFGISILEAIACHTFPLLPNRLSYPEIIPAAFQTRCFYADQRDLFLKLQWALQHPTQIRRTAQHLAAQSHIFSWAHLGQKYDQLFRQLVNFSV